MNRILVLALALVLLAACGRWMRVIVARLFGRRIGNAALAKTPDAIRLVPAAPRAWRDAAAAEALCGALLDRGFDDGGLFEVAEMPGVVIRLFADPGRSFWAAVYEHPRAGRWTEVVTRYEDGTSATYTTLPRTGLAPLPGHIHVHSPGLDAEALVAKASAERPRGAPRPACAADAARAFADAYADGVARRKRVGVSTKEVVAVARLPEREAQEQEQPVW